MVYKSSLEAGYGIGVPTHHVDASGADRIDIPDAALLFRGHFAHAGPDLILTGDDGQRFVITGYFASEKHPDLVAPNGAHLTGDLVDLLAGSPTAGHYAQAKTVLPPEAIGKVEKVVGQVTLIHNGVSGPLHVGDPVYKTDIVQTGTNSSCGIAFPDGTALDLVNNTRMALNEYNFDPNSAANGALFSLVEGTFAFVAGQVAHTGEGMKINTPIATMGIRGTVGLFRSEPTVINSTLGHIWSAFLHEDIDGSHHLGRIAFIDMDPTSPTFGQEFYLLDSSDYIAYFEPQGPGQPPHVRLEPITNSKVFDDRHFYEDLGHILNSYQTGEVSPGSSPGVPGSGDNPNSILLPPDLFDEQGGKPLFNFVPFNPGSGGPFVPFLPTGPNLPPTPVDQGQNPTPPSNGPTTNGPNTPPPPSGQHFIWTSPGPASWSQQLADWNLGSAPNSPLDSVEIKSGTSIYDISGPPTFIAVLQVDSGAILEIKAGQLVAGQLIDNGTIIINSDPILEIDGSALIGAGHTLTVSGGGNKVEFNLGPTDNLGIIAALQGAVVDFNVEKVTNESGAKIVAAGEGSEVNFLGASQERPDTVDNFGVMAARHHGEIQFQNAEITNELGGKIRSVGEGSEIFFGTELGGVDLTNFGKIVGKDGGIVAFFDSSVDNKLDGIIEARRGGEVSFLQTDITNEKGALIGAVGCGALIDIASGKLINAGDFLAAHGGYVQVGDPSSDSVQVDNQAGGLIKADRGAISFDRVDFTNDPSVKGVGDTPGLPGGVVKSTDWGVISFHGGSFDNGVGALVEASHHGSIFFEGFPDNPLGVTNKGEFDATGCGSAIRLEGPNVSVTNDGGSFFAKDGGEIVFDSVAGVTNENGGEIAAKDGGTVIFKDVAGDVKGGLFNTGTVAAVGCGSTVDFFHTDIAGGTWDQGTKQWVGIGALDADGGTIFVSCDSQLLGNISVEISHGGLAHFADEINQNAAVTVTFDGVGTLQLDRALSTEHSAAPVMINGFGNGDVIDLTNLHFTTCGEYIELNGNVLTVFDNGASESFTLEGGNYSLNDFELVNDGHGGTDVVFVDRWINRNGGIWGDANNAAENWSAGIPGPHDTALIDATDLGLVDSGHLVVDLDDKQEVANLIIGDNNTELDIDTGGSLKILNMLEDSGAIVVGPTGEDVGDPSLRVHGSAYILSGGSITAHGEQSFVDFYRDFVEVAGSLRAEDDATVSFHDAKVWNDHGDIEANSAGLIKFDRGYVQNDACSTIDAQGWHSEIDFRSTRVSNDGRIEAKYGGFVDIDRSTIKQDESGLIAAIGCAATVLLLNSTVSGGAVEARDHGIVMLDSATICDSTIGTQDHGKIATVAGWHEASSTSTFDHVTVTCGSHVEVGHDTTLIATHGTTMHDSVLSVDCDAVFDVASHRGATLDGVTVFNHGLMQVEEGSTLHLQGTTVVGGTLNTLGSPYDPDHPGGVIEVVGAETASVFDGRYDAVTVEGNVQVRPDAALELRGEIDLAGGIIELDSSAHGHHRAQLLIDGHVTLTGDGVVVLTGPHTEITGAGEHVSTLDNEATIVGAGNIGSGDCSLIFVNHGLVDATGAGAGPIIIDTGWHAVSNTGILEASGGSELDLHGTYDNWGGQIIASAEGYTPTVVKLFDATIKGGSLVTDDPHSRDASFVEIVAMRGDDNMTTFDGTHHHAVTIDGYVLVDAGANLALEGTIHNHGTIEVDGKQTDLVIDGDVTLDGHGTIQLDSAKNPADQIVGDGGDEGRNTLDNVNNTIEGAGNIGSGDRHFSLVNESCGTIDANDHCQTLTIDTGHNTITNAGTLAACNGGKLDVESAVDNAGGAIKVFSHSTVEFEKSVTGGSATIDGGTLKFDGKADVDVTFATGHYGELVLGDAKHFSGAIHGFNGLEAQSPNLSNTDEIDLVGVDLGDTFSERWINGHTDLVLTISKNGHTLATLTFDDFAGSLSFSSDQHGGTLITDPPAISSQANPSVSIGGAGNDTFVFHPGEGAQTINNFNPQQDTIELDHFGNMQNLQELTAAITPDAHGNAVLELGHGDSIAIPGVSATFLQQHVQSLVHLHG